MTLNITHHGFTERVTPIPTPRRSLFAFRTESGEVHAIPTAQITHITIPEENA